MKLYKIVAVVDCLSLLFMIWATIFKIKAGEKPVAIGVIIMMLHVVQQDFELIDFKERELLQCKLSEIHNRIIQEKDSQISKLKDILLEKNRKIMELINKIFNI